MIDHATRQAMLANWRRTVRSYGLHIGQHVIEYGWLRGQTESLEGNYRSPQTWHPAGPRSPEADQREGWMLEAAWREVRPLRGRALLRMHYITALPEDTICRRLRTVYGKRVRDYWGELGAAEDVLFDVFEGIVKKVA